LEGPDEYITLARAAQIAGLAPTTLRNQALAGWLRTVRPGHDRLTTRRWLHAYLRTRGTHHRGATPKALPDAYIAPQGEETAS
jgi:hypothetical protein